LRSMSPYWKQAVAALEVWASFEKNR